jgi:DNA-binding transcriptional ArsR family regulator
MTRQDPAAHARYGHVVARRAAPPTGPVVLSDASAVRALAHPARLVVIDALYAGRVLTATECAALAGTTPSAMSYHLRALEKYGLVKRAEGTGDARERPWVRAGDRLSIDLKGSEGAGSALAAAGLLVQNSMAMDTERLLASMRSDAAAEATGEWKGTTQYARDQLVMTADEARELAAAVERLVAPYAWDKRGRTSPKGATNYSFSVVLAREVDDS